MIFCLTNFTNFLHFSLLWRRSGACHFGNKEQRRESCQRQNVEFNGSVIDFHDACAQIEFSYSTRRALINKNAACRVKHDVGEWGNELKSSFVQQMENLWNFHPDGGRKNVIQLTSSAACVSCSGFLSFRWSKKEKKVATAGCENWKYSFLHYKFVLSTTSFLPTFLFFSSFPPCVFSRVFCYNEINLCTSCRRAGKAEEGKELACETQHIT